MVRKWCSPNCARREFSAEDSENQKKSGWLPYSMVHLAWPIRPTSEKKLWYCPSNLQTLHIVVKIRNTAPQHPRLRGLQLQAMHGGIKANNTTGLSTGIINGCEDHQSQVWTNHRTGNCMGSTDTELAFLVLLRRPPPQASHPCMHIYPGQTWAPNTKINKQTDKTNEWQDRWHDIRE